MSLSSTVELSSGRTFEVRRLMSAQRLHWLLAGGEVLFAWGFLWNKLRIDWSVNEQYQYGWFVPPLAFALLALRWPDRPAPAPGMASSGWKIALPAAALLLLLLPLRLLEEPNPDWRLLFWVHGAALTGLSLYLAYWCGGRRWVRHFGFPVLFLLLAIPWPSGPEQTIVQSLMRAVAAVSAGGMNLLGIPAIAAGNLIHVRDQWVGVDEACSGIRSLQTALMAGFLLGELSRLSWPRRFVLLGGGIAVAMIANVFRSSVLVWIVARHGSASMERFHDSVGVSILLIVFASLLWLNSRLARVNRSGAVPVPGAGQSHEAVPGASLPRPIPFWFLAIAGAWLIAIEAGTASWYSAPTEERAAAHQRWTVAPPVKALGFQNVDIDARTRQLLRFDEGFSARWKMPDVPPLACTLFFFRWNAGHASIAQAEMHQPHICLTASGLTQTADWGTHPLALPDGITLPVHSYAFSLHGRTIYVFYVVWQDGVVNQVLAEGPGSRWDRLRAVIERRHDLGRQTLEFIVGGPTTPDAAAALFEQAISGMVERRS